MKTCLDRKAKVKRMQIKPIKKRITGMLAAVFLACSIAGPATLVLTSGCTNPQSRITLNSIATVSQGAKSAYDAYSQLVILGQLPTNDLRSVSMKYNLLQNAVSLAIIEARQNTNAIASEALNVQYNDLLNSIAVAKSKAGK